MKKILSLCLIISLVLCGITFTVQAQTTDFSQSGATAALDAGLSFVVEDKYCQRTTLDQFPSTVEATVYLPADFPANERGGTIIGNYAGVSGCLNIEIHQNGALRYYTIDGEGITHDHVFKNVSLARGQWVHIALVRDLQNQMLSLYVDGEYTQSITTTETDSVLNTSSMVIGGDRRTGNAVAFKGRILNLALYADIRTADEIRQDITGWDTDGLLAVYDFSSISGSTMPDDVPDLSDNHNELHLYRTWVSAAPTISDYDYAIAFVPDTQVVTYYYPDQLPSIYDWIVGNVESKNIQFVVGLGDITERDTFKEWALAEQQIDKLNGVVRYSLVRGNHDSGSQFNEFFPYGDFENMGGSYDYRSNNTWQEIRMGQLDYLFMSLDYGADDEVLEWASNVIAAHPNHNVIISTHAYLFRDGTTLDDKDVCPPSDSGESYNDGDDIWEKLVKKHENIVMVVCGHDPCDNIIVTQTPGEKGNIVTQMLIDAQSVDLSMNGVGMVAIAYFSNGGQTVQMEYYSTIRHQWYMEENQFTMQVNVIPAANPQPAAAPSGLSWKTVNIIVVSCIVLLAAGAVVGVIMSKKKRSE